MITPARRPRRSRLVAAYLVLVLVAAAVAVLRLVHSTEMPGLAAIEIVLLALPWSLALGMERTATLGWPGMAGIVVGGVALNALLIRVVTRLVVSPDDRAGFLAAVAAARQALGRRL